MSKNKDLTNFDMMLINEDYQLRYITSINKKISINEHLEWLLNRVITNKRSDFIYSHIRHDPKYRNIPTWDN